MKNINRRFVLNASATSYGAVWKAGWRLLLIALAIVWAGCTPGRVDFVQLIPSTLVCPGDSVRLLWGANGEVAISQTGGAPSTPARGGEDDASITVIVNETTTFTVSRGDSSQSATVGVAATGHVEPLVISPFCRNCGSPSWSQEIFGDEYSIQLSVGTVTGETGGRAVSALLANSGAGGTTPPLRLGETSNAISGPFVGGWVLWRMLDPLEGCTCLGPTGGITNPGVREPSDLLAVGVELICVP